MIEKKCPNCGRNLIGSADGRIGQCKLHGWFPVVEGAETEAAKRNADERSAKEHAKLQAEADKQRAIDEENEKHHKKIVSIISAIVIVLVVAVGLILFLIVKPSTDYNNATNDFEAGHYESAMSIYSDLGEYKDSAIRASLCNIMLMIQNGDSGGAKTAINELVLSNSPSTLSAFAGAVSPLLTSWETKGVPPDLVIAIITKLGSEPLQNNLDSSSLWMQAHVALLPDSGLHCWQMDVNGDNKPDLIIAHEDGSVSTYDMTEKGNRSITVDDSIISSAAVTEAKAILQSDPAGAVSCIAIACGLDPNPNNRTVLQEYCAALVERWKAIGANPSEVLRSLGLAVHLGKISMDPVMSDTWHETALTAVGEGRQHTFVDWNSDGLDELLILNDENQLQLYGYQTTWKKLSELTELPANASYTITDDTPVIVLTSDTKDSLVSATCAGNKLHVLFSQDGIIGYSMDGTTITYSVSLPGSIDRTATWRYQADSSSNRAERTAIDWQKDNYPMPASADQTTQRYLETRVYEITEEAELLTAEKAVDGFSVTALSNTVFPTRMEDISFSPYSYTDDEVLYEVLTTSAGRTERLWYAVKYDDQWRIAGVSDSFEPSGSLEGGNQDIKLICSNVEVTGQISDKGGKKTHRLLLPKASRVTIQWQAGLENGSSTAFIVGLYRDNLSGNPVITYNLKLNKAKQQTCSMFLAPGVYYITVEEKAALHVDYHLTVLTDSETNIELEGNDVSKQATPIVVNQSYSGSLLTKNDIDFYAFELSEGTAVNISLKCSGTGDKKTAFIGAVYNGATGEKLTTFDLAGNTPLAETGNLYLGSGVYLIQINKGTSWTDEEYSLTVTTQTEGVMEAESNNTPATANVIPVNEEIHGSISTNGDVDCYRFTVDSDAAIQLQFSFASTDSTSKTYVLTVMDNNQRILQAVNIGGKETSKVIAPVALKAGTYTVKVENPRFIKQEYVLRIVSQSVSLSEGEPNNAASAATSIEVGKPITGVLSSDQDEDYYKITFASQTTITFSFSFTQGTSKSNAFILSIERNGKTEWKQSATGASGGLEQAMTVPAGEYYIRVKPGSAYNGNLYTISIQ